MPSVEISCSVFTALQTPDSYALVLQTSASKLSIINYQLSSVHYQLSIIICPLSILHYQLSIVNKFPL
ncbi:hypothetical protein FW774_06440 [Pedobacter sp. BS3]|nr:hypothetical protein FW774_06440 [Pedobacter sp. BS3]